MAARVLNAQEAPTLLLLTLHSKLGLRPTLNIMSHSVTSAELLVCGGLLQGTWTYQFAQMMCLR